VVCSSDLNNRLSFTWRRKARRASMPVSQSLRPTHLSIFATDPATGQPSARPSLYAEVAVPRIISRPPPETRIREPMTAALNSVDPGETDATRQLVIGA